MKQANYRVDLPQLIAVCDANYIRLLKLVPALKSMTEGGGERQPVSQRQFAPWLHPVHQQGRWCFDIEGAGFQVCIGVTECFRYTQTLEVVAAPDFATLVPAPAMQVRVYHDAASAEVVAYQQRGRFAARYARRNTNMYQQDEKLQNNQFLAEWLNLCLAAGVSRELLQLPCPV